MAGSSPSRILAFNVFITPVLLERGVLVRMYMDLPGEKLVIKLWETLAEKGIGSLLEPWHIKRTGRARNEVRSAEMVMLAQAEVDANDIRAGRKHLVSENTPKLIDAPAAEVLALPFKKYEQAKNGRSVVEISLQAQTVDAIKREINVSKAVLKAEDILASDKQEPSSRPIDDDWLSSWRDYAGRVSTEDLQQLWGSVLAGELKTPGTHSLRTLEFMKGLSKNEAEKITTLAGFVIEGRIFKATPEILKSKEITFDFLLQMQMLGIVTGVESLGLTTTFKTSRQGDFIKVLRGNGKAVVVRHEDAEKELKIPAYLLTPIGAEILSLGSFTAEPDYLAATAKWIADQGFRVQVGDWTQLTGGVRIFV